MDYLRFDAGHRYGGTSSEAFYQLNLNRAVPVLQDGDNPPLREMSATLRYLVSRYADDAFWPGGLLTHAEVDRQAEWSRQNVAFDFMAPMFWHVACTPAAERDSWAIVVVVMALEQKPATAEARLAGSRYLVGDTLILAGIRSGHVLYRYFAIDITRHPLPYLAAYCTRLTARPAFRQHVIVSYDELRV